MVTPINSVSISSLVPQAGSKKDTCADSQIIKTNVSAFGVGNSLIKHLTNFDKPIVFFDVETTGLEGNSTRMVEICLVKLYPSGDIETWTTRINPEIEIPKELTEIHGIRNEDVKDCLTFKDISQVLFDFISDSHLGGYNTLNLDLKLLKMEFTKAGFVFDVNGRTILDPMKIFHRNVSPREGGKRRLIDAYKYYCGKDLVKAHSAFADITATIEVLEKQFEKYNDLPRDIYKLGELCQAKLPEYVDSNGKLLWQKNKDTGDWEIICGYIGPKSRQYRGKPFKEVVENDREYMQWILEPKEYDFSDELKQIISNALKGIYPSPPSQ